VNKVKLVILVTLCSVLVWVYAENESLSVETMAVSVELSSGTPNVYLMPSGQTPWGGRVTVQVRGSTAVLDRLRDRLSEQVVLAAGSGELPRDPGLHRVDLRDALRRDEVFRGSGATIEATDPDSVEIEVLGLERREVELGVETPGVRLASPASVTPERVWVSLPETVADRLESDVRAVVTVAEARLDELDGLVPGRETAVPRVPIRLEPVWLGLEPGVSVEPDRADVTLTVASRRSEHTIPSMPVQVVVPAVSAAGVDVRVVEDDYFLEDVRLAGPAGVIDRVARGDVPPPLALVRLDPAQLAAISEPTELQVQVRLTDLPSGVEVVSSLPLVRVMVSPRTETGGPSGSGGSE